jgi:hypothetical protein
MGAMAAATTEPDVLLPDDKMAATQNAGSVTYVGGGRFSRLGSGPHAAAD